VVRWLTRKGGAVASTATGLGSVDRALVVATDLVVPRLPSPLVERPRLFDVLDRGVSEGVLTLVCAHAGTGKTVLLSSWAARRELPGRLAWLTLRPHAGEATFWAQLAAALAGIVPESSGLARLDPPRGTASTAFLNRLLNGFAELDSPIVLVLDDFHTAPPGLTGRIASLLHGAPEQLRLVLASRTDPRLPLHLLRVSGELTEIRAAGLAFTLAEAEPLLEGLDRRELRTAVDWTQGWAAGIRLLALSLRDQGDRGDRVARFAAEGRTVADYLAT
jgi:LuxR family transcriptional regulator, maltose regulon positive regulatory protein